jgi:hypothetical protein
MRKAILLLSLVALSCGKGDLGGTDTVSGVVYWNQYLANQTAHVPLPGLTLYIQYSSAPVTVGYLYSTTTDSTGHYLFTNLDSKMHYSIYATLDSFGIQYTDSQAVQINSSAENLTLQYISTGVTGFNLTVNDNVNTPIGSLEVWVFSSSVIANQLYSSAVSPLYNSNDSIGAIFSIVTDSKGNALATNIPPATYYIYGYDSINPTLILAGLDSVVVTSGNVKQVTVQMAQP